MDCQEGTLVTTESDLLALYRDLQRAAPSRASLAIPGPADARPRQGWPLIVAACLLVLALISVPVVLLNRGGAVPANGSHTSAVAPAASSPPQNTLNWVNDVEGWADSYGDPRPTSAQVAQLTRAQALTVASYFRPLDKGTGTTVLVFVIFGSFSCPTCSVGSGSGRNASGTRLVMAIEPNYHILGAAIDTSALDLSSFPGMTQLNLAGYVPPSAPPPPVHTAHPSITVLKATVAYPAYKLQFDPPAAGTTPRISAQTAWDALIDVQASLSTLPASAVPSMQLVLYTNHDYSGADASKLESTRRLIWLIRVGHAPSIDPRGPADPATELLAVDATTGQTLESIQGEDFGD
jgi:hypothetical protein